MKHWHPQDWLLVIEALTTHADRPATEPWRARRCDELVEAIAAQQGLDPERCVEQVDVEWPAEELI